MFTLTKSFTFEASHQLPHHNGKCRNLHGHSYQAKLIVSGKNLQQEGAEAGMLVDFGKLSAVAKEMQSKLDHKHLNDVLPNPTSELLARWIFEQAMDVLPELKAVEVNETATTSVRYEP